VGQNVQRVVREIEGRVFHVCLDFVVCIWKACNRTFSSSTTALHLIFEHVSRSKFYTRLPWLHVACVQTDISAISPALKRCPFPSVYCTIPLHLTRDVSVNVKSIPYIGFLTLSGLMMVVVHTLLHAPYNFRLRRGRVTCLIARVPNTFLKSFKFPYA